MNSEKNLKRQRKQFAALIESQIYFATLTLFGDNKVIIRLPRLTGMNEENIKPTLKRVLGYVPEITLYQEAVASITVDNNKKEDVPVVLVELKLENDV